MTDKTPTLLEAALALLNDIRTRYPGEELRCPYMRDLDAACTAELKDKEQKA